MSQKSIKIISISIVLVIITCVVWVLLRETTYKSQYSTSVSAEEVADIQRAVKGYYATYSSSLNRIRELNEPSVNIATYDQDGRITDNFIKDQGDIFVLDKVSDEMSGEIGENSLSSDPILCAQDDVQVSGVEVLNVVSTPTPSALSLRAIALVSFGADGSKKDTGYYAEVGLVQQNEGKWLIDTIECKSASVYVPSANDKIIATSGAWSIILRIEGQIGGAFLVRSDSKGVQKIIAVDEDMNYMIEKFVPTDVAQNLKKILHEREVSLTKNREVNSAKKREADKNPQGIVKDKSTKTLPVFKLTYIEASEENTNSAMDYPRTKVQVQYGSKMYDLKTYIGHFDNAEKENWTKLAGEVAGIVSWYAGAGDELRIIDKGDRYIVVHKEMDSENGYESEYMEVKISEIK